MRGGIYERDLSIIEVPLKATDIQEYYTTAPDAHILTIEMSGLERQHLLQDLQNFVGCTPDYRYRMIHKLYCLLKQEKENYNEVK